MNDAPSNITAESEQKKRDNFVRLAEKRTINAIKYIRRIGKLGNNAHYEYDDKDVKKIVRALRKEVDALRDRLSDTNGGNSVEFKL